jgi:tetratricopeptide (TPR) repeat protein
MSKYMETNRILPSVLLLVSFGVVPWALPAQSANQTPAQTQAAPPSPAPASTTQPSTAQPLTAEQTGDSLLARQRYQAAIAAYAKAPQMSAAIWNKMGIAYQMLFNEKDAIRCYKESHKLDANDAQVLNNLGTVYASLKEYGQADKMYRKALKLDPGSALILKNFGTNLLAEHKYTKGWEAYRQAVALDPEIFADHAGPSVEDPSNVAERGAMNYYMAAGCASAGYTDCALEYLRRALDEGFVTRKKIASDSEFASLRNNPAFQQLIAEQRSQ